MTLPVRHDILDDSGNITVNGTRMAVTMARLFEAMSDLIKLN